MLPQSTVVDGLNGGMAEVYADPWISKELDADVQAQVHDSILLQVPIEHLKSRDTFNELYRRIKEYTSPTMEYHSREFKIATDFKVGLNWGGHHSELNPLGMDDCETFEDFQEILKTWGSENGAGAI